MCLFLRPSLLMRLGSLRVAGWTAHMVPRARGDLRRDVVHLPMLVLRLRHEQPERVVRRAAELLADTQRLGHRVGFFADFGCTFSAVKVKRAIASPHTRVRYSCTAATPSSCRR